MSADAAVCDDKWPSGHSGREEDLLAAVRVVASRQGITVRKPARARPGRVLLSAIALNSHFHYRRVTLRGNWWQRDSGPFLGFLRSGDQPVALLPVSHHQYQLVDPNAGTRHKVTAEIAAQLRPDAYVLYRPLPERPVPVRSLLAFGFGGSRSDIIVLGFTGLAAGLLALIIPVATTFLFSRIIPTADRAGLVQIILLLIVAAAATGGFWLTRAFAILRVRGRVTASLQFAVWDRMLNLPASFFRRYTAGDLGTRSLGILAVRGLLTAASVEAMLGGIFALSSLALLFYYDAPLALAALCFLLLLALATVISLRTQLVYQRQLQRTRTRISSLSLQLFAGIPKLRVAGAEKRAFELWNQEFMAQRRATVRSMNVANWLAALTGAAPIFGSLILFVAVTHGAGASMSAPRFLGFSAAFTQFLAALLATTIALSAAITILPLVEDLAPILQTPLEVDATKRHPGDLAGGVCLDRVSFRYDLSDPRALEEVSIRVEPGQFVAIVGPSGSGKSTILRLLLGLERPDSGRVLYDGLNLADLDVQTVREQVGAVLQDAQLMPTDILTNITGGLRLSVTEAWEAARLAGLAEDIRDMPMGMHTVVSEEGTVFSRGQRQRLLIARAIAARPRVVLLDEATSALDNRTQAVVMHNLAQLGVTRIAIAHRLSTVIEADRIFLVVEGKVAGSGTYGELVRDSATFAELARRQLV